MSAKDIVMSAAGVGGGKTYVEDVFSTYLYTGNGSTQTINNGIDLAGKGGMVWIKQRQGGNTIHGLFDTTRGANNYLVSNTTVAQNGYGTFTDLLTSFNSNGFSLGADSTPYGVNQSPYPTVAWTFRKAPKFFDVVTYTGNGVAGRTISHSLGQAPGMIFVKCTSNADDWIVYHRSTGASKYLLLNTSGTADTWTYAWNNTAPTSTQFTVGEGAAVNASGRTFVAYLFAHDTTTDGLIQCGSFTADSSGNIPGTINLGWEPQYILRKQINGTDDWAMQDTMRGFAQTYDALLFPNQSSAEFAFSGNGWCYPTATGFAGSPSLAANGQYIYMAIRRGPMRTPTDGTKVFSPSTWTSNSSIYTGLFINSGFPVDLSILGFRNQPYGAGIFVDRLRGITNSTASASTGGVKLDSSSTAAEVASSDTFGGDSNTGVKHNGMTNSTTTEVNWNFQRAPGFFDVVCYTGTGVDRTEKHSLGVVPELIIVKKRSAGTNRAWVVGSSYVTHPNGWKYGQLNDPMAFNYDSGVWSGFPTKTDFPLGTYDNENGSGATYVAYLFASCPGVSKVGSYTGNGSSQTINCGFAAGARFVLIKRTDSTGDWYVWDTARGIVAASDPNLILNSTVAEVATTDDIDPISSGFIVNQVATTNVNVSGGTYIYLSIA